MSEIIKRLFELQDLVYRDFQCKLMPTVDKNTVIGVRTPLLRAYAKEIRETELAAQFMEQLPHKYYEENNLHAFLIEGTSDFDECVSRLDAFLPFVDNWATCDSMSPRVFKKHPKRLLEKIGEWISAEDVYTVRFAIGMLMKHFLDDGFEPKMLHTVAAIRSDEYYIRMMIAWYFATALAKQYSHAVKILEGMELEAWVHNKAIQKAIESYRISDETKSYLRKLKIKKCYEGEINDC